MVSNPRVTFAGNMKLHRQGSSATFSIMPAALQSELTSLLVFRSFVAQKTICCPSRYFREYGLLMRRIFPCRDNSISSLLTLGDRRVTTPPNSRRESVFLRATSPPPTTRLWNFEISTSIGKYIFLLLLFTQTSPMDYGEGNPGKQSLRGLL